MSHKAGFVNIIGNPNVGKSTLMNVLVGEKLSIITPKAQTTRHRILGIVNGNGFQLVLSDTPGILKPHYKLQQSMLKFVNTALKDADIILYMTDVIETSDKNHEYIEKIAKSKVPVLLLINKSDLATTEKIETLKQEWANILPKAECFIISALQNINISSVLERIVSLLPESPPYFPENQLTDKPERFFVSEIIREKILKNYEKEIPYSTEVEVEEFKEDEKIIRIRANIHVTRDSQKGIIIGHKGAPLKKTGTEARQDIEDFFGKKAYLGLYVKVNKNWRNNEMLLKRFGYNN